MEPYLVANTHRDSVATSYSTHRHSPEEIALAALFWVSGPFPQFASAWLSTHSAAVKELLYGTEPHLRLDCVGLTPEEVKAARKGTPEELTKEAVLAVWPRGYLAPPWVGFKYTQESFRDWHLVTHRTTYEAVVGRLPLFGADLLWAYTVEAKNYPKAGKHTHSILSFRFSHPQAYVRKVLHLDKAAQLEPLHTTHAKARNYLWNQHHRQHELGRQPKRWLWRDGNQTTQKPPTARAAIAEGENTQIQEDPEKPIASSDRAAILSWVRRNKNHPKTKEGTLRDAKELATNYTGRVFEINYSELLPGVVFSNLPPYWYGEEVVFLRDIPRELLESQLAADWINSVAVIVYQLKKV